MSYHVAPTSAGPRTIWGYRFTNLRDAMEEAEALSKERDEAYSVWEMKHLWSSDTKETAYGTALVEAD